MKPWQRFATTFCENSANLLKVKTIVTLSVVATFCALTLRGTIGSGDFLVIATAVITYYFTKDRN